MSHLAGSSPIRISLAIAKRDDTAGVVQQDLSPAFGVDSDGIHTKPQVDIVKSLEVTAQSPVEHEIITGEVRRYELHKIIQPLLLIGGGESHQFFLTPYHFGRSVSAYFASSSVTIPTVIHFTFSIAFLL